MRKNIKDCVIVTDNSHLSHEFAWSIRYSTHCNYYIDNISFPIEKYIFINSFKKIDSINNIDYMIEIKNQKIKTYRKFKENNNIEHSHEVTSKFIKKLKHKLLFYNKSITSLIYDNLKAKNLIIYIFFNFEGDLQIIGIISSKKKKRRVEDHNSSLIIDGLLPVIEKIYSNIESKIKDQFIRVDICLTKHNLLQINTSELIFHNDIRLLRASGINIPLLIIQNLHYRKIKSFRFLDNIYQEKNHIYLSLVYDTVFFDLDETLIWEEQAIYEIVNLLHYYTNINMRLILLTRHTKNINKTLKKIKISPNIFFKIIKVEKNQKKSEFTHKNSLLLDNEFPQRIDVFTNTKIPVIDLDQVEFLGIPNLL